MRLKLLFTSLLTTTAMVAAVPSELVSTRLAGPDITPSPACLCAHPNGDVYVGVDLLGSLGKGSGKGSIVKLVDTNNDGTADQHSVFAKVDNPRGLFAVRNKLYVLHTVIPADGKMTGMHLSVLIDADGDGKADGPPQHLVKNISTLESNQKRGADHTTNGIRMGIDGWIYIAIGDFGLVEAKGADGKNLTMLGGGILRVRPDGTEMEVYTHGLRNIYDVAIDPFMNIFTRGNTNDGGGWNVRFIDQIQSGEYGYPVLFKHFTDEIIPALKDFGGGSGTGALFFQEPGWPQKYNNVPMMADWGRNHLYIHRITPDGPTFTQKAEDFIQSPQISDVDVDGSGRLYLAAWDGAGYRGDSKKGFVDRVVPKDWKYIPFPNLTKLTDQALVKGLLSASSTARLHTSQEILHRAKPELAPNVLAIAQDATATAESRVAAIYTYAQIMGAKGVAALQELSTDPTLRESALRAMADRTLIATDLDPSPFIAGLKDKNPRVQVASAVALGRIGKKETAKALLKVAQPPKNQVNTPQSVSAPVFASKTITGTDSMDIDVDINRIKDMFLIIENADSTNTEAHAAWFNPILIDNQGGEIPLTQLKQKTSKKKNNSKKVQRPSSPAADLKQANGQTATQGLAGKPFSVIHFKIPFEYVRLKATIGLTTKSKGKGIVRFIVSATAPITDDAKKEGPHATPNSPIILPHIAVQSLVQLKTIDDCLAALGGENQDGALWALRLIHEPKVVDGLIAKYESTQDDALKLKIIKTLGRLYQKEKAYDGSWWWGTQPETAGPYYKPETWSESTKIANIYRKAYEGDIANGKKPLTDEANKLRLYLPNIGNPKPKARGKNVKKVGDTSIEDVMLAFEKNKYNQAKGKKVFANMASCGACHNLKPNDPIKGPNLLNLGNHLTRDQIAEAILKPAATIAETWVDVTLKQGGKKTGTLISKNDQEVIIHNIAGIPEKIKATDVSKVSKADSTIMGPHLADQLTLQEFTDMVNYLHSLKGK